MRIIDWSSDVCSSDLGLLFRYRALVQRAVEALAQLARVEGVAAPVGLDDRRQLEFDRLQRAEALAAGLALAPAADRRAVLADARVDDAGVCVLAEEAMHQATGLGIGDSGFGDAGSEDAGRRSTFANPRSEEHTSELQSLMRISYAVF